MAVIDLKIEKELSFIKQAEIVLNFLNEKTGLNYLFRNRAGDLTKSAGFIIARLKEGYTMQELKTVIVRKTNEWLNDDKMRNNLSPDTLFNRTKFEKYLGQCV